MAYSCRGCFLTSMGAIYFCAFSSYYLQYPGLLGEDGLLPARNFWERVRSSKLPQVTTSRPLELDVEKSLGWWSNGAAAGWLRFPKIQLAPAGKAERLRAFFDFPSLLWFLIDGKPSLQVDQAMDGIALLGIALSVAAVLGLHHLMVFAMLYLNYLTLFLLGQRWLGFQWDIFLLETGAMLLIYCPVMTLRSHGSVPPAAWLLRALIVKFMYMNGVVKVTANCPTWKHLSALEYHFASTCIPTSEAWIHHQLPPFVLRFGVAIMFLVELVLPWMLVVPVTAIRRVGVISQAALQLGIMVTGNYNWFNFHTIVLLLPAWEDDDYEDATGKENMLYRWATFLPRLWGRFWSSWTGVAIAIFGACSVSCWAFGELFEIRLISGSLRLNSMQTMFRFLPTLVMDLSRLKRESWEVLTTDALAIESRIGTREVNQISSMFLSRRSLACFFGLVTASSMRYVLAPLARRPAGFIQSCAAGLRMLVRLGRAAFVVPLLGVCLLPLESVYQGAAGAIPFSHTIQPLHDSLANWHVSTSYGLFRRMTGVGEAPWGRKGWGALPPSVVAVPGVVVEGSSQTSGEDSWKEIPFRYSLGKGTRQPRRTAPHQPRLDWQMWFAALGSYQHNDWFLHLLYKILEGSEDVLALLDVDEAPWPSGQDPPKRVRAWLYHYDFTRLDTAWARSIPGTKVLNLSEAKDLNKWWTRSNVQQYIPEVSTAGLKDVVRQQGWLVEKTRREAALKRIQNCTPAYRRSQILGLWCDSTLAVRRLVAPTRKIIGWKIRSHLPRMLWRGASDLFFIDIHFVLLVGPLICMLFSQALFGAFLRSSGRDGADKGDGGRSSRITRDKIKEE